MNGNSAPSFDADEKSMRRRISNVPYTQSFEGNRADPNLPEKLSTPENLSAFLKILVDEAVNFYREGLLESDEMKVAKDEYIAENDFVSEFISENCKVDEGGKILRSDFEEKLARDYPREVGRYKKKEILQMIQARLETLGATYTKDNHNKNVFKNVKWLEADKTND